MQKAFNHSFMCIVANLDLKHIYQLSKTYKLKAVGGKNLDKYATLEYPKNNSSTFLALLKDAEEIMEVRSR